MSAPSDAGSTIANGGARWRVISFLTVVALAVAVGFLTAVQQNAAAAVASVTVLGALLLSARSVSRPIDLGGRRFRWLAFAWTYVMIRPVGHFTAGRTPLTAVGGAPSVENIIDLGTHAAIAAFALWSLRSNRFSLRPSWLLLALPAMALLSAAWSVAPTVTLGFSFELVVIYLLAVLTAAIQRVDPNLARSVLRRTLRIIVWLVAGLCIVGLILPHSGGASAFAADTRFTWPGEHPLVATAEVGFALLVIVFAGRSEIGFSRRARIPLIVLFAACLYLGHTRTAFVGLVAAALFGYWLGSKDGGWAHKLAGVAMIGAIAFLIVSPVGGEITQYLYRGQTQQQVFGLNGRLGLWTFTVHQLHTPGQWLFGYGLSATRVFLASNVGWAGDAHGAWFELLLSLGLVGVVLAVLLITTVGSRVLRSARDESLASRALPVLFAYVIAMSPAATGFAAPGPEPGLGFALLAFCYAATASLRHAPLRALAARSGGHLASDLRSVPAMTSGAGYTRHSLQ